MIDLSGSAFYSEPTPEAIGSPVLKETGAIDTANPIPLAADAPAYVRYAESGVSAFAPSAVTDPTFQPDVVDPQAAAAAAQPAIPVWLILGGLALLAMFLRGEKN